jgi:hypothetical protein
MEIKIIETKEYRCPKCNCKIEGFGETKKEVRHGPKKGSKRVPMSPEELETIKNWTGSISELARKLGRHFSSVYNVYKKVNGGNGAATKPAPKINLSEVKRRGLF